MPERGNKIDQNDLNRALWMLCTVALNQPARKFLARVTTESHGTFEVLVTQQESPSHLELHLVRMGMDLGLN